MSPDYNPNSIWTSKREKHNPLPESKKKPGLLGKFSHGAKKASGGASRRGDGEGHGLGWFFVILAAFIAGAAFYFFFLRSTPSPDVSISFAKPDQVFAGDPFIISVSLSNNSAVVLKNATLDLALPDGLFFKDQPSDVRVLDQAIGDIDSINSGSVPKSYDFTLISVSNLNSASHIVAKLVYGTDTTGNAQFESVSGADVVTGLPAIGLNFVVPADVFSGQNFSVTADYHNNTSHAIQNVVLRLQYPPEFTFGKSSVPSDSSASPSWNLGTIAAGGSGSIMVTGMVNGSADTTYPLTGKIMASSGTGYVIDSETANIVVATSPLSLSIALNGTSTYIADAGDSLKYVLSYANNSNVALQNIVIRTVLVGDMYNFASLKSNGSFNSITDTITWSLATNPEFASLVPGQSGSVDLALETKRIFPIKQASDKNHILKIQAQIQSITVPPNTSASSTIGMASLQNKVGGNIAIAAVGYRKDVASGITNTGPYPPVVDQPSQYTIHWDITNYSTDVRNVVVSAYLQSGSVFTGQVKSNVDTQPTYDATTGLVTWTIPSVPATTGVIGPPAEAVFQITNTPAVNQIGQVITLMGQTSLSAEDTFTSSTLNVAADPITTYLSKDPTTANQAGQVAQ